ncbi:MAG: stage III sporulation protein AF [Clostridia bacterium]
MIEFLSDWAKSLGLAIIIVSILEMILPNNKTKKYVRMIFGLYIIFNIIVPFIQNKDILNISNYNLEEYNNYTLNSDSANNISASSKIEQIYVKELEQDITEKITNLGYKVTTCNAYVKITEKEEDNYIEKIALTVDKTDESQKTDDNNKNENETFENQLVEKIQKINPVNTKINKEEEKTENNNSISKTDILKIKKFLVNEYGVDEKCLKIN